ncbi:Serine/threonine protein kinase [Minicystis rosea]|nr:Serine/threonine protein kinase PrkC, regulator of stationary phase [Minicystis rosea]APR86947.1 Serine/threonine protein kinase [Minicystis rosea]
MLTFKPGDVFGQLAIESFLGAGLHGEVYAVRHVHTDQSFALKVSHLVQRADANAVRRALTAAKGTYSIEHANVVKVFDLGCEDDGMVWIRMELLQGCSIATLLAWQGRLSPRMALAVAYEAAWGLAAAHEAQIVHRDVKPGNLFLVNLGRGRTAVKLLDFSVAKVLPDSVATTLGRNGLGTPGYMPAEQIFGAPAHPCFDIYALGMTLWTMLAGYHPFQAHLHDMHVIAQKQVYELPPSLADAGLPPSIDDLVRRAVLKDPSARYPSMTAFARAIGEAHVWLAEEIAAGRLSFPMPPMEPAIPGAITHRAYVPPVSLRQAPSAPAAPAERVILAGVPDGAAEAEDVAATLPLGEEGLARFFPVRDAVIPPAPPDRKENR